MVDFLFPWSRLVVRYKQPSVLTRHQIPWLDGQQEEFIPLQWLPVILSTDASAHTERPNCLTAELPTGLDLDVPEVTAEAAKRDYLVAFIQYTTGHINDLQRFLNDGLRRAFTLRGAVCR